MNTGETIALIKAFGGNGGGGLPPVTPSDNGKVLGVVDGEWAAQGSKKIYESDLRLTRIQPIPVVFHPSPGEEEFPLETAITPENIGDGYNLPFDYNGELYTLNVPPYSTSWYAVAYIYSAGDSWSEGARFYLISDNSVSSSDGVSFYSPIVPLDELGLTGMVGQVVLETNGGHNIPYRVKLKYWSASEL